MLAFNSNPGQASIFNSANKIKREQTKQGRQHHVGHQANKNKKEEKKKKGLTGTGIEPAPSDRALPVSRLTVPGTKP